MKKHLLLIIIVIVSGQTNKSDLELLVDDLSILARVTNAIALQTGAFDNSIQLEDVVAELIQVTNQDFSTLMGIDSLSTLKTVTEFYQKSRNVDLKHSITLESINQLYEDVTYLVSLTKEYGALQNVYADRVKRLKTFQKELDNSTNVADLMTCDTALLEVFAEFQDWTTGKTRRLQHEQFATVKNAFDKIGTFSQCLDLLETYDERKETSSIMLAFNALSSITRLAHFADVLLSRKANSINSARVLPALLKFFQDAVDMSKLPVDITVKTLATAQESFLSIEKYGRSEERELTSGFENTNDLSKVIADVNSDWFKGRVAKGSNVTVFKESLKPFTVFAESIQQFGDKWHSASNAAKGSAESFKSVAILIENVVTFNGEPLKQSHVDNTVSCWNDLKQVSDRAQLEKFYNAFRAPFEMNDHVRQMSYLTSLLNPETNVNSVGGLKAALSLFAADYARTKLTVDGVVKFQKHVRKQRYFEDTFRGLNVIVQILDTQKKLKETINKILLTNSDDFEIGKAVTDTKILDVIECFKDDAEVYDVRIALIYMLQIKYLADAKQTEVVRNVLEKLESAKLSMKSVLEATANVGNMSKPNWTFPNSKFLVSSFSEGVHSLHEMNEILRFKSLFEEITKFHPRAILLIQKMSKASSNFWYDPMEFFENVNDASQNLTPLAKKLHETGSLSEMKQIFEKTGNVKGVAMKRADLRQMGEALYKDGFHNESKVVRRLSELELNFASHDLKGAALSLISLEDNFDALFGNRLSVAPPRKEIQIMHDVDHVSYIYFILLCLGLILLLICVVLGVCALTPSGRAKYVNTYLYYCGKEKDFEKRWRYSLFLDRLDGKNALIDAVREVNVTNVQKTLKRGAYVNVYNFHGNTCLHSATKLGYPEIVKLLIKNGADRTLLNHQNKVPEDMIPRNQHQKAKSAEYEAIRSIYSKYRKKMFRMNVPEVFPVSSFHIYIEERTDNNLTNAFMDRFQSITSEEPLPTTTHCIVKTTEDGVLETDQFSLLAWIFNGVIIVKDSWMADCLKDEQLIRHDSSYLVEKVRYKGVLFENAVLPWSRAMAKGTMPFLYGVHVAVVMREYSNLMALAALVTAQGGTMLNSFPRKENYNRGSHPYLHSDLGPLFIIHDGQINLDAYKDDDMFTLFTEDQFLSFMLKREVTPMHAADPISVVTSEKA